MKIDKKGDYMHKIEEDLLDWSNEISEYTFPRWEELPDFDLYMDQVLNLIERYLAIFKVGDQKQIITSSMINNYVKLGLIPPPIKKKYTKKHLAYLIAISILKQVVTISEVKEGILYQASISGIREAYDLFCTEQEYALRAIASHIKQEDRKPLLPDNTNNTTFIVRTATIAVATKIVTEKVISIAQKQKEEIEKKKNKTKKLEE